MARRQDSSGRFIKADYEVKQCSACGSKLAKLLVDSRAETPNYVMVCDNRECSQYRLVK